MPKAIHMWAEFFFHTPPIPHQMAQNPPVYRPSRWWDVSPTAHHPKHPSTLVFWAFWWGVASLFRKKPCETSRPTWLGKKNVPLCFRFCDGLLGYDTVWTKTSVVNRLWRMRRHHYVKNEFVQSLPAQDNPRCCRQSSTNQWALRSRYKHSFSWWFDFNDAYSVGFSASAILLSFRV